MIVHQVRRSDDVHATHASFVTRKVQSSSLSQLTLASREYLGSDFSDHFRDARLGLWRASGAFTSLRLMSRWNVGECDERSGYDLRSSGQVRRAGVGKLRDFET